jgi:hypothetical protein
MRSIYKELLENIMYMLVMVIDDASQLAGVLQAWESAGISGVTILESTGINRVLPRQHAQSAMMGFSGIFRSGRVGHNTIFAIIESTDLADQAVAATEAVVGSLKDPHTGIIFLLPVAQSWGLKKDGNA